MFEIDDRFFMSCDHDCEHCCGCSYDDDDDDEESED